MVIHSMALSDFFNLYHGKLLFVLMVSMFFACQNITPGKHSQATEKRATEASSLTDTSAERTPAGGQKDEHGCLTAAGYTWSQVKQSCVRVFESGIRMNPQDARLDQTTSAFIIFNDDQTVAELFLPGQKASLLLERTGTEGNYQWKNGDYALSAWKGYVLKAGNRTLYHGP